VTATDQGLVDRIARGDSEALGQLMSEHGPALMRFASHFLRSSADADEVLQDVFLRAERAIRRGTRPERMDAWLFRIAVNRCRSKRRRWWPFVAGREGEYAISAARGPGPEGDSGWREEIDAALARLSPTLREAFLLKHVEGMEYQEMAAITGASISALKMRVARACQELRQRLAEVNR
jgi:RNA polymerase sigma-70 factor (ECF subfamily)